MSEISQFRFPTDIRFGAGAREQLEDFARLYKVCRPLLVCDPGIVETSAYKLISATMDCLWANSYSKFTSVHPNPTEGDVESAWLAYRDGNCDGVIALGGGSALDAARAMRLKVQYPDKSLLDMPFDSLPEKLTPMRTIPTTAGTGSEVGRSSAISIDSLGRKAVLGANPLMAEMAILDPELTVSLPKHLTAWTGMDAMTHAVESYVCPLFHPMCDAIALEAIRLTRIYLPRAYKDANDIEARGIMQMAAAMGAIAFQKDLGAAHSLAHPLSSEFGIQHGLANAIVLPGVIRFNGEKDSKQYERVADALGIEAGDDPAVNCADFINQFNKSIGIDQRLSGLGVEQDALKMLAKKAFEDSCHATNPRKCSELELYELYKKVY